MSSNERKELISMCKGMILDNELSSVIEQMDDINIIDDEPKMFLSVYKLIKMRKKFNNCAQA
tara:strand:- start:2977 stop:3162 length:186 start_codon:yes stop_codon:yes gene_type:complete